MDIVLTGTGSPLPDPNRAGHSTLVKAGDTHILVDAGRGVVLRLAGAGSDPALLAGVLITHLHSDHICALNDVITTHSVRTREQTVLPIYGPVGTARFVERQIHALEDDIGYRIEHHDPLTKGPQVEVTELQPGDAVVVKPEDRGPIPQPHAGRVQLRQLRGSPGPGRLAGHLRCLAADQRAAHLEVLLGQDHVQPGPGRIFHFKPHQF